MKKIRIVDLFAGVGGFRLGLEAASDRFETVWSNQWEPSTKSQDASRIYVARFGAESHSNVDIAKIDVKEIPNFDMVVAGFPCQDYSVAKTLSQAQGIQGKKGVLWWQIHRIVGERRPGYLFLENVDRLLKSPADQRGRDFAIILASLSDLGYAVEWRVINAADYGFPQRRRRVFILAYSEKTGLFKELKKSEKRKWATESGVFAQEFGTDKNKSDEESKFEINGDLVSITRSFNKDEGKSPFSNSGVMVDRKVYTAKLVPSYNGKRKFLGDVMVPEKDVPEEFFINGDLGKWKYLKGAKDEKRFNRKRNFEYNYNEGPLVFPDALDRPSRTIVTGEGGSSPSRFKHVVRCESGRLRRLIPVELERLNTFPDNHTEGISDTRRAFMMGNALVVGVVEKIGRALIKKMDSCP